MASRQQLAQEHSTVHILDPAPESDHPKRLDEAISLKKSTPNNHIWKGNFTIYLLVSALLSLWFTAGKGLPLFATSTTSTSPPPLGPVFAIHLITVCIVSWGCIWNLFHSPSHGPLYRTLHIAIGRIVLLFGFLGVLSGF